MREFLPISNFTYVVLLEYMGMSPDLLRRESKRWGDLGEIIFGRSFSEDRLEFTHSAWHFMRMPAPAGEAARRSKLFTDGKRKEAFAPSNWEELMRQGDYYSLTAEELAEINSRALPLPYGLKMDEIDPDRRKARSRPSMYGPPMGTWVRPSKWSTKTEYLSLIHI